jgi:Flp pilus assembly protein TadG
MTPPDPPSRPRQQASGRDEHGHGRRQVRFQPNSVQRLRNQLRDRDDRGSASLQLVVVFPVLMLMIFGVVQGALYYHARTIALAAAQEGLRDARVENGTASSGAARAREFIAQAGDGLLTGVIISPSRSAVSARVTVRGRSLRLFPGLPGLPVSQTADGPVERLTTAQP